MRAPLSHMPLLPVALSMATGIIIGRYVTVSDTLIAIPALICLYACISRHRLISVIAAGLALGWGVMIVNRTPQIDCHRLDGIRCQGLVKSVTASQSGHIHADVVMDSVDRYRIKPVTVRITAHELPGTLTDGDIIGFTGTWHEPRLSRDMPDCDDLSDYYYNAGISALCYVEEDSLTITGYSHDLYYSIRRNARHIGEAIDDSRLTPQAAAFVKAVITGDGEAVGEDERERFGAAGLAHVMALSGMHVALLMLIVSLTLVPLDLAGKRHWRLAVTIAVIWLYAVATGLSAPVVRASVMATLYMIGRIAQRRHSACNSICAAAVVILIFDPKALFTPGFQLSFAAVVSILLLARRLNPVSPSSAVAYKCAGCISVPVAAAIGTGVLGLYHFHRFAPMFILSNVPVALMMPVMFVCSLLMILVIQTGASDTLLTSAVQWLYDTMDCIATFTAATPGGVFEDIYISTAHACVLYLLIAAYIALPGLKSRMKYPAVAALTLTAAVFITCTQPRYPSVGYHITRTARYTDIAVQADGTYYLVTTSSSPLSDDVAGEFARINSEYIRRRHLTYGGIICTDTAIAGTDGEIKVRFSGNTLHVAGRTLRLIDTDTVPSSPPSGRADYALVTRRFKGDITRLARYACADTIILLREINPRRSARYAATLDSASIPCLRLRPD